MSTTNYDIIIAGSGPAGTACALALKGSGLRVLVLDKNTFPRDKVCGDAIPNTVPKALRMLDEKYLQALRAFPKKVVIDSCKVVAPSGKNVTLHFKLEGYASARIDFDEFISSKTKSTDGDMSKKCYFHFQELIGRFQIRLVCVLSLFYN